jgi:ribosomal protein S18 acetylase RimI-like enzyme
VTRIADAADRAHSNFVEFTGRVVRADDAGEIDEGGGALSYAGRSDHPMAANGAFRTDDASDARDVVRRARDFFAARGRGFTLFARDHEGRDDDLVAAALEAGLVEVYAMPEMICDHALDQGTAPADGAELRRVSDEAGARDYLEVAGAAYATLGFPEAVLREDAGLAATLVVPGTAGFVAYEEGRPVSAAMCSNSHGVTGIFWVGSVEAARGRGLGEACTRAATNAGFEMGADFASLQASHMGEPIYRRMGYEEIYRYRLFLASP